MGHAVGKDLIRDLGRKVDNLHVRSPWNGALYAVLREIFTDDEARLFVELPYLFSTLARIAKITKSDPAFIRKNLESLADKGLVIDLVRNGTAYYMPSPMAVGIFEFTMMKTGGALDPKKIAPLFRDYFAGNDVFFAANMGHGKNFSSIRALVHEHSFGEEGPAILDYESALSIVEGARSFSIGACSCRHKALHSGGKQCPVPLDTCLSLGWAADYLVRHGIARSASKEEVLERLSWSRTEGLVLSADNVRKNVTFICQCCSCCCVLMKGINDYGYHNTITTSSYMAAVDSGKCTGCGACAKACPVRALEMVEARGPQGAEKKLPRLNEAFCLGCGVCTLGCKQSAIHMKKRKSRYLHPETTFERVLLQCTGLGTLQNQIFDNPGSITQEWMRGFIGGLANLPVMKRMVLSDLFQSRFFLSPFVGSAKAFMKLTGRSWITRL